MCGNDRQVTIRKNPYFIRVSWIQNDISIHKMIIFRIDDSLFIELYKKYRIIHTIRKKDYGYDFINVLTGTSVNDGIHKEGA